MDHELIHRKWQYHLLNMLRENLSDPLMNRDIDRAWKQFPKGFVAFVDKDKVPPGGQGLAKYLAKYVVSPPISVRRILSYDGKTVRYLRGGDRYEETLTVRHVGERCIVWWERNEEGGWGWTEGEGILDRLVGIREELMRGDCRALFLGWLADFDPDEWRDPRDGGVPMPPIPPGLDCLTPALRALIERFPVDRDALAAAAGQSESTMPERAPVADVLDKLSVPQMKSLLARVAEGDGSRVMSELNRLTHPQVEAPTGQPMSCVDFATKCIKCRKARQKREAKAAAEKRKREKEARARHLESVLQRADTMWAGLDPLVDRKVASAYDEAAAQLKELRDAYKHTGKDAEFQQHFAAFRDCYSRRPAMMRRIEDL